MQDNFDDYEDIADTMEEMSMVLEIATRLILDEKPFDEFLQWGRHSLPDLAHGMFAEYPPEERDRIAYWMTIQLWNVAPLPANNYKPRPVPSPGRNTPCPCGSGKKYKQCCAGLQHLEPLPGEVYWPTIARVLPKTEITRQSKSKQFPISAIAIMAQYFFDQHDHAQVIKMLDPQFEGTARRIDKKVAGLLDMLCDSYDMHYNSNKKKLALLQRMRQHNERIIRAEALQRIASIEHDRGNRDAAFDALNEAIRVDPGNPSHPLLELTLLLAEDRIEQARQRAAFWYRKWRQQEYDYPDLVEILRLAQTDPRAALQESLSGDPDDDRIRRLQSWADESTSVPMTRYTIQLFDENDMFEDEPDEDNDTGRREDPLRNAVSLQPPDKIARIEARWEEVVPVDKPFSVHSGAPGSEEVWPDPDDDEWIEFLVRQPQAINSLEILDDLVNLVADHPFHDTLFSLLDGLQPLLDRAEALIRNVAIPDDKNLPWIMPENRPALRLLVNCINQADFHRGQEEMERLLRLYLRLNPEDNHGYRALLINHYLRSGQNAQALSLAKSYPDDMLPDTLYGHVLASYRLGSLEQAAEALAAAVDILPLVPGYLVKKRIARPKLNQHGVSYGGKDQAWIYREEMRDCWLETPDCLKWLKQSCA